MLSQGLGRISYGKRTPSLAIEGAIDNPLANSRLPRGMRGRQWRCSWGPGMHARNQEYLHASRVTTPRVWTGLLLNESYKVGSLIEQGATTELYDGTEVSTGEPVALKILLPQLADDAKTRTLFLDEARVLTRLSQPGLHRYRSCARDPQSELTYIVTDVVGTRLSSRLGARKLSQQDIVDLTKRLALALGRGPSRRPRPSQPASARDRPAGGTARRGRHHRLQPHQGRAFGPQPGLRRRDARPRLLRARAVEQEPRRRRSFRWSVDGYLQPRARGTGRDGRQVVRRAMQRPICRFCRESSVRSSSGCWSRSPRAGCRPWTTSSDSSILRSDRRRCGALLNRAPSLRLPRFRRSDVQRDNGAASTTGCGAKADRCGTAETAAGRRRGTRQNGPLPPLPDSLLPAKKVPLGKFHEAQSAMGPGGIARRAAVALTALLLAASPWIIQTSFPRGPADASTVAPPAPVPSAKAQAESRANQAARAFAALPKGQVYGSDNTYSRVTLRVHRPTRVIVHSRGTRLLFNRMLQPGDSYRTPSLADLTVTTEDAGAVEVVLQRHARRICRTERSAG